MYRKDIFFQKGIVVVYKLLCKEMCECVKKCRCCFDRSFIDSIFDLDLDRKQYIFYSN